MTIDSQLAWKDLASHPPCHRLRAVARIPRCAFPDGLFHVGARGVAKMPICVMGNHYHLVVDATRSNLSVGIHILNGFYAQGFNGKYRRWGHVFGDRFWSRSLREDDLERTCIYVMENPVRAGLCERAADWPWSACRYELG